MAKPITKTWQEALKLCRDSKVVARPQVTDNGARLMLLLQDSAGQKFVLSVKAVAALEMVGNLIGLKGLHNIEALELEPNDVWEE